MKKGLIICSTPYQVMIGALLKMQCFQEKDSVNVILTDTFLGYETIAERIKKTGFYNQVYTARIKRLVNANSLQQKIRKAWFMFDNKRIIEEILGEELGDYDELYFNCEEVFTYNLISLLRLKCNCKVFRYEEGYSSYNLNQSSSQKSERIIATRNKITKGRGNLHFDGFYVFEPDLLLYEYKYPILSINREVVQKEAYREFVSEVFDIMEVASSYKRRYIIFEESFATDGFDVDDLNLYQQIISTLGKDNVTVKLHPRSNIDRFRDMGVDVHASEGIPWEAILLSKGGEKSILLALASGSVINSRLLLGDATKAVLLYKCLEKRPPALGNSFDQFLEKFTEKYNTGIIVPDCKERLEYILEQL